MSLSFFPLEDLPNEILLIVFTFFDIKGVLQCGQVSKRLRKISNDKRLWLKLNLFGKEVPYGFIEKAIQNGCEYLNLSWSHVHGGEESEMPWKLKYLEISKYGDLPEVLKNCHSLQKLAMDFLELDSDAIEQICQNGETLRVLSLGWCSIDNYQRTESIQKLLTKCHKLTELNISKSDNFVNLLEPDVRALVDNLTPNILKLDLSSQGCVTDKHVNTLVQRCTKIIELDLSFTEITNDSMDSIIGHLKSLEKLSVVFTNIDFSTLLQLKSIPTLKILRWFGHPEEIKNLKIQLPHISINEEYLYIAVPTKKVKDPIDLDWFWEIKAKQQTLFPKAHYMDFF